MRDLTLFFIALWFCFQLQFVLALPIKIYFVLKGENHFLIPIRGIQCYLISYTQYLVLRLNFHQN